MVVLTARFILQSTTIKKHISLMQKVDFRGFSCISATYYSYVSVCMRVLLVCISVCSPFVSVCCPFVITRMFSVFVRMLSVCIRMLPYVVRSIGMSPVCCPYVFRMLSVCYYLYVPLCIREALVCYSVYVTRLCPCVVLVKIGCRTELTILLLFSNGQNSK